MAKYKVWREPMYRVQFAVIIPEGADEKLPDEFINESIHPDRKVMNWACAYWVGYEGCDCAAIAINPHNGGNKISHSVISHEVFHAASMILSDRGITLSDDSDEAFAYLIGRLTEWVYSYYEELGITIQVYQDAFTRPATV